MTVHGHWYVLVHQIIAAAVAAARLAALAGKPFAVVAEAETLLRSQNHNISNCTMPVAYLQNKIEQ
jgi:hypothetical protein